MRKLFYLIIFLASISMSSCKKYLSEKSDLSLTTPSTFNDLEAMLDHPFLRKTPTGLLSLSDEYFLNYTDWLARTELDKNFYIWEGQTDNLSDWGDQYTNIFYTNTVLDILNNISRVSEPARWDKIKGSALFFRAYSYFNLAQLFAKQYEPIPAATDLGVPLRFNSNFNIPSERLSLQKTYDQIFADLAEVLRLLPDNLPISAAEKARPSKAACHGLLARIYLQLGNYVKAKESADACLNVYNSLLDFNSSSVQPSSNTPILKYNQEQIFISYNDGGVSPTSRARMDSILYSLYNANDLRKTVFFRSNGDNTYRFKGSFNSGSSDLFTGIATGEIYLIRAECFARMGNISSALQDLRTVLQKRWRTNTYNSPTISNPEQALRLVLEERRRELVFRGLRWLDLRRLNLESNNAVTIRRNLNGVVHSLAPNDLRYTLLIPFTVISLSSIQQNPR